MKTAQHLTLAFLLIAAACGGDGLEEGKIKLLSEGDTAKAIPLQLSFQQGSAQTADAKMNVDTSVTLRGRDMAQPFSMKMSYRMDVDKVEKKGGNRIGHMRMNFTDMSSPQVPRSMMRKLQGMKIQASMDQRGKQGHMKLEGMPTFPGMQGGGGLNEDQMNQILDNIYPDIPDVPVGPGGSWKIKKTAKFNGGKLTMIAKYTLIKIDKGSKGVVAHLEIDGKVSMKLNMRGASIKLGGKINGNIVYVPAMARVLHSDAKMDVKGRVSMMGESADVLMKLSYEQDETSWTPPKEN